MRILITDDDLVCTMLLSTLLKSYGECVSANNGQDAIRQFTEAIVKKQPFDLVCLDILMPEVDGQVTLRCLRAIEAGFGRHGLDGATILMITTEAKSASVAAAFRGQCEGYLIKPFDESQLAGQLEQLNIKPLTA